MCTYFVPTTYLFCLLCSCRHFHTRFPRHYSTSILSRHFPPVDTYVCSQVRIYLLYVATLRPPETSKFASDNFRTNATLVLTPPRSRSVRASRTLQTPLFYIHTQRFSLCNRVILNLMFSSLLSLLPRLLTTPNVSILGVLFIRWANHAPVMCTERTVRQFRIFLRPDNCYTLLSLK